MIRTAPGRYEFTASDGSQWICKRRPPELGGWAWQAWPAGSAFDDPRDCYGDTRKLAVAAVERRIRQ